VTDSNAYAVWQKSDDIDAPSGKYLVEKTTGKVVYLVDPGINGAYKTRPDGTTVTKFDAPKATLMSYIIKGILDRKLPWGLVLFGVMIALVLEMSGIPSLAFAVGVYLPLSSSSPILVGGAVRWLVDRKRRKDLQHANLTEEQLGAEGDKSSGVLMASGYIAGGAIAGIIIAFMAGVLSGMDKKLTDWSIAHNPFFDGGINLASVPLLGPVLERLGLSSLLTADLLAMIPFAIITALLYLVGREILLGANNRRKSA
jgi:hypothetical protein